MKYFIFITLFALFLVKTVTSQELILKMTSPSDTIDIGETLNFTLLITPTDIDSTTSSFQIKSYHSFIMKVEFVAKENGEYLIGPYEYEFEGKLLKSNTLKVIVKKPNEVDYDFNIFIPKKVKKKEEIVIVFKSCKKAIPDIKLKDSTLYSVIRTESASSMKITNGNTTRNYQLRIKFKINKRGKYIVTRDWFINYPESFDFENQVLIVK